MRKLERIKRELIVKALTEGMGIRAVARLCGVTKLTVTRLLCDIGKVCADYHDQHVRNLATKNVEVDEVWAFIGCKTSNQKDGKVGYGDVWVWAALDVDSRLVISYHDGSRGGKDGTRFLADLAGRVSDRIQLTSDSHNAYDIAIPWAFGDKVDWAKITKVFGRDQETEQRRYSPPPCIKCTKTTAIGLPDLGKASTSHSERQNLNLRTMNRRYTRLTNGYSRRFTNHVHAISLHYFAHNWIRKVSTLKTTPAVKAGLADRQWTASDLITLLEYREQNEAFGPVGSRINRADRANNSIVTHDPSEGLSVAAICLVKAHFGPFDESGGAADNARPGIEAGNDACPRRR
jgi:IS1 family transposase